MLKLLLLAIVVAIAVWMLLRPRRRDEAPPASPPASPNGKPAAMIPCAHCGVHLPLDEALVDAGAERYCSEAHRALGPR